MKQKFYTFLVEKIAQRLRLFHCFQVLTNILKAKIVISNNNDKFLMWIIAQ